MSLVDIVEAQGSMWYVISMPLVFLIFFLSGVAEVGRSPFDLIEAESEIIAGFHTEYSGIKFGMFMIGEYVHMFALSFFTAVLFFGGWQIPFVDVSSWHWLLAAIFGHAALMAKVFSFVFVMMWFRGTAFLCAKRTRRFGGGAGGENMAQKPCPRNTVGFGLFAFAL